MLIFSSMSAYVSSLFEKSTVTANNPAKKKENVQPNVNEPRLSSRDIFLKSQQEYEEEAKASAARDEARRIRDEAKRIQDEAEEQARIARIEARNKALDDDIAEMFEQSALEPHMYNGKKTSK